MNQHYIINNNITFESKRYRLVINNKEITLSQKETELLEMLCISSLAVVERNHLLQSIWGSSESADIGLNKNILMLRRKFESIGINNAIKTIPRIGYMLLLEVKNIKDEDIHQAISIDESEHLTLVGEQSAMDNTFISKRESITPYIRISKKVYIYIAVLVLCLTAIYFFITPNTDGVFKTPLDDFNLYTNHTLSLFLKKGLNVDKHTTIKAINDVLIRAKLNSKFYLLATDSNISIASVSGNGVRKQSNFILDNTTADLNRELPCAVNNFIEHGNGESSHHDRYGEKLISMRFFKGCHAQDFLVDVHVVRSGHPEKIKTVLQSIFANDSHHRALFHFDRTSEYESITLPDGTRKIIFHNAPSPLDIDNLNLIGENEHIIKLIAEFTSAKTTHVSIDQKNNIFMSDIMGGILYAASEKL
ncbi:DNA-binding winged helix-turn-helix (wHTH) protein [Aeromonas salmonicida]|uniref:winged helix-turn-helix domain-containing protein n=1 Tax=Aeromonas salmonicida TaxID=645 RepID=UPI002857A6E3|nr:winged helix-turn-helix domain-containing protein [Aeromonas salmonicida]MDR6997450.1 DNA-binding winged helix-turn-helix (wHTH) protein [Aeromonas salmonicida]